MERFNDSIVLNVCFYYTEISLLCTVAMVYTMILNERAREKT